MRGKVHLTDPGGVDVRCIIIDETCPSSLKQAPARIMEFRNFAAVGFNTSGQVSVVAADIEDLGRAIKTLEQVYREALKQMPEEEQNRIVAQMLIEDVFSGDDGDDV